MSSTELQVGRGHGWREPEKRIIISNRLFILPSTPRCSKASSLPFFHLYPLLATSLCCRGLNPDPSVLQRGASAALDPPTLHFWAEMAAPHDLKVMIAYLDHDKPITITQCRYLEVLDCRSHSWSHSWSHWDEDGCLHPYIVRCVPQYPFMVAKTLVSVAEGGKGVRKQTCSFPLHVRGLGWGLGLGFASTDPWSAWPTLPMSTSSASTLPSEAVDTATIECVAEVHDPYHDGCHPRKQHSHPWRNRRVFLISNLVVSCSRAPSLSETHLTVGGRKRVGKGHDKHFTVLIKGPYMSHISFYMSCWSALRETDVHCVLGLMAV